MNNVATEPKNGNSVSTKSSAIRNIMENEGMKARFNEILGKNAPAFISSVLSIVSQNDKFNNVDPTSIVFAAATAASLKLPVNPNLGHSYIIPYKDQAQFQVGYKGFIQLAQRSGMYRNIGEAIIYEGQLKSENPLTGYTFDFTTKASNNIIGYAAAFTLNNGFEKTIYLTKEEVESHGRKYSKAYGYLWSTDFDKMALKTVVKMLLSKYGPLSIDLQTAMIADQSVVKDLEGGFEYPDNATTDNTVNATHEEVSENKELDRISEAIENSKTVQDINNVMATASDLINENDDLLMKFSKKLRELKSNK